MKKQVIALKKTLYLTLSILGLCILTFDTYVIGTMASFFLLLLFMYDVKQRWGYVSLAFLYLAFFLLYSFSVPLSIIWDIKLSYNATNYVSTWMELDNSLIVFSFCVHLAILGMILAVFFLRNISKRRELTKIFYSSRNVNYFFISIILGVFSTLFQFINFFRVGGLATLSQGKLVYQSAISDSTMMLPDEIFFYFSVIFFMLSLVFHRRKIKLLFSVLLFFIVNAFYLFINLYIGERGTLLLAIFVATLTYFYYSPLYKIKFKYLVMVLFLYFSMIVLTTYRSVFVNYTPNSIEEMVETIQEHSDLMELFLNPANSEFGAPCLNFRMMYTSSSIIDYRFGVDYLHFVTQLLPMKINPIYDKSLTVQFRNKYVPERGEGGSIGGTGYSSIMESYLNFGYLGPIFIYLLVFLFIISLELKKYNNKNSLFNLFVYVSFFQIVMLFQRSSFEYVFINFIFILITSFIIADLSRVRVRL